MRKIKKEPKIEEVPFRFVQLVHDPIRSVVLEMAGYMRLDDGKLFFPATGRTEWVQ